jgi:hypothetical protein
LNTRLTAVESEKANLLTVIGLLNEDRAAIISFNKDKENLAKANFHLGKLSVDWNGQENSSLSCELWVGTNVFNTKKNVLVRSNPIHG